MGRRGDRESKKRKQPHRQVKRSVHRVYVGPWGAVWQVKLDGKRVVTSILKQDAEELGTLLARLQSCEGPTELTVTNRWGKIRRKDTYTRKDDPASSKG